MKLQRQGVKATKNIAAKEDTKNCATKTAQCSGEEEINRNKCRLLWGLYQTSRGKLNQTQRRFGATQRRQQLLGCRQIPQRFGDSDDNNV